MYEEGPGTQTGATVNWQQSPRGKRTVSGVESSGLGIAQSRGRGRWVHAIPATLGGSVQPLNLNI